MLYMCVLVTVIRIGKRIYLINVHMVHMAVLFIYEYLHQNRMNLIQHVIVIHL